MTAVRRLDPVFVERVWGRTDLSPLYGAQDRKIGEVWFPVSPEFPLLVKFIFTSERLSVQVHPDDEFAKAHESSRGKTEMWHILAAEPGAKIALGMRQPVSAADLKASLADGSVVDLLNWLPVQKGDTLFAPARTVHAIGAGIVLCEIQQNSDVTYRLFDYGRPRELHLEKGLAVSETDVCEGHRQFPVRCDHFTAELLEPATPVRHESRSDCLLIPVSGTGMLDDLPFRAGECWLVPGGSEVTLQGEPGTQIIRTAGDL